MKSRMNFWVIPVQMNPPLVFGFMNMVLTISITRDGAGSWNIDGRSLPFITQRIGNIIFWYHHFPDTLMELLEIIIDFGYTTQSDEDTFIMVLLEDIL